MRKREGKSKNDKIIFHKESLRGFGYIHNTDINDAVFGHMHKDHRNP